MRKSVKNERRETCHCTGNSFSVDMTAIGDKLQGAKVIHNHPDSKDYYGDCFSMNDFSTFFEYQLKRLEVVSGLGGIHWSMRENPFLPKNPSCYIKMQNYTLWIGHSRQEKKLNLCS